MVFTIHDFWLFWIWNRRLEQAINLACHELDVILSSWEEISRDS